MSTCASDGSSKSARAARAEAAVWMVRLHGDERTPELEAGFQRWLAADAQNARQFEHIADIWELGGAVAVAGLPRLPFWPRAKVAMTSVLALVAAVAIVSVLVFWSGWGIGSSYATGHGEQRLVRLEDGSSVYLNSDSRLRLQFSGAQRRVRLERGEGLFEVATDPRRPFVVQVGEREVTALGTTFVVRYESARTAITLVEGRVSVSPSQEGTPGAPSPLTLTPGERLTLAASAAPQLDSPRMEAVTAWRRGQVLFEATTLPEAVAEMNRYDRRPVVIDDRVLNVLQVSGVYRAGDSLGFARAVAELHGLVLTESSAAVHLRPRRPSSGRQLHRND